MKLSELDAAFRRLRSHVDRLVEGVAARDFDARLRELQSELASLEAWTKPGGGGSFEVDIEPYVSDGGAPRFMQERAGLLLAAATTLRNARRARTALRKHLGATDRGDLAVPLAAPLKYSDEDIARIQRVFKYLYARRAYRKLRAGEVVIRSVEEGYLPANVRNIEQLSKHNLGVLRRAMAPLTDPERRLYSALSALPFHLKHATTTASWANIFSSGLIFSRDALVDWNIVVRNNSPLSDEVYKQDVDFAFFRVEVGTEDWVSRFGQNHDQLRAVFNWQRVIEDGWVSLHDMLAPLGTGDARSELRTRGSGELVRTSEPDMPREGLGRKKWIYWKWKHTYPGSSRERTVHILDEVFYGPDILPGLVLAALRDLRELPPLQREAFDNLQDPSYAHWLIKSLFRVEAKYPSAFRFEPEEVVATYGNAPPALRAATDLLPDCPR